MDEDEINHLASVMQMAYSEQKTGEEADWSTIGRQQRSIWRHVARVAEKLLRGDGSDDAKPDGEGAPAGAKAPIRIPGMPARRTPPGIRK